MPRRASKTNERRKISGKRYPLNIRTTQEIRRNLENAAEVSGRSLAQEVELRIEHAIRAEEILERTLDLTYGAETAAVLEIFGELIRAINLWGSNTPTNEYDRAAWLNNRFLFDEAVAAFNRILDCLRPEGDAVAPASLGGDKYSRAMGREYADGMRQVIGDPDHLSPLKKSGWANRNRARLGDALISRLLKPPTTAE